MSNFFIHSSFHCTRGVVRLACAMTIRQQWTLVALAFCAFLGACTPAAEGTHEEQKNPFYLAGKERVQAMDYAGAVESFEKSLQQNPRSVLAHFELGLIYEQHLGDYAAALYHYGKALKLRPAGYPAETIHQRIPACRQELLKADSLTLVAQPSALREMEKLREENQELRRQLGELKATLAAGSNPAGSSAIGIHADRAVTNRSSAASASAPSAESHSTSNPASSDRYRYYTVRPGETLASISRAQNIRMDALLAANPGVDPKRLKIGQTIKVPVR
jgi:LysM repeat protein